jgi:hypothetical protein
MHDFFYKLGFVEEAGAMQANNFGKGDPALQGDPLVGLVQAGAAAGDAPGAQLGRDNAYMFPNPDGLPSWSGMFLFETIPGAVITPCVDGDFDAQVIYHEYAHGVTNRWVGGESGNLETHHGGSMGESWSDFYAMHYLFRNELEKTDAMGPYVTGNPRRGIRNFPLSKVPLGLGDFGYDVAGEEVHSDGEIWNGVLWDIRTTLARANKKNPNAGADMAAQLIGDAMPIAGPSPDMLDMRDAILAADKARTKGANQSLLWTVFARRGMGASAFSKDANDVNPRPAYDHKDKKANGRFIGRVLDIASGRPIAGARVQAGQFVARTSPLTKTGSDGSFQMLAQAGRYTLTIQAKGYGSQTLTLTIPPGQILRRTISLALNYASAAAGAEVVESSSPSTLGVPALALDDNETSVWLTDVRATLPDPVGHAGERSTIEESFVVKLAGDEPVDVSSVRMSAMVLPGTGRFNAARSWKLFASLDGDEFDQVGAGEFVTDKFRPVAPNLNLRTFKLDRPVRATYLRVVASPVDSSATRVELAEFEAFGRGEEIRVASSSKTSAPKSFHDEGSVLLPTADANVTHDLMVNAACQYPPPTQGLDAWVTDLPAEFADGTFVAKTTFSFVEGDPRPDTDMYFLSDSCESTGSSGSGAAAETGTITQATRFIVTHLYTGLPGDVAVDVTGT